jgi:hypothetical protein
MHNCDEFRERITEYVIDREEISAKPEFRRDLLLCSGCAEFYAQSREMIQALDSVDLSVSESHWWGIERRLQAAIFAAEPEKPAQKWGRWLTGRPWAIRWATTPFFLSAAALVLIAVALSRLVVAPVPEHLGSGSAETAVYVDSTIPLDPVTVDFLEESELLLRNVMKIEAANVEGLADARKTASQQLAALEQRKEAAAEALPVVSLMETYETVLRDIRNVDDRSADEDIGDIQRRIQQNGLIANIKAFQPRVTEISFGLR